MLFEELAKKPPSLVDLCVRTAIDHVKYIGYVGGIDFHLLDRILQHCSIEQLKHIEDSTQDTDLSPITNKFWKRFYGKDYGEEDLNLVMKKMKLNQVNFKWRDLHEAKSVVVKEKEKEAVDRLKQLYKKEDARKQSRQTKVCSKAPPIKRPFWGSSASSYNVGNVKSNIMKKAKIEVLKSQEVKNLTAIKRKTIHKSFSISAPKRPCLSTNMPSTSRSIPYDAGVKKNMMQKNLSVSAPKRSALSANAVSAPKRSDLSANAPSTSRSMMPFGGRTPPPKRISSLAGTAPSTSRKNAAIGHKNVR